MKKVVLFVLTVFAVTTLVLALAPVSAKADAGVFPTGVYTTTITAGDVAKYGLPSPYPELLIGDWEMIFGDEGSFEVRKLGTELSAQGTYMANPAVLIFGKDSGALACIPPGNAAYQWSLGGTELTLTAAGDMSDRCWGRFIVFTSHPLVKKQP